MVVKSVQVAVESVDGSLDGVIKLVAVWVSKVEFKILTLPVTVTVTVMVTVTVTCTVEFKLRILLDPKFRCHKFI